MQEINTNFELEIDDGHRQLLHQAENLRSYAQGQVCLEQANVVIARGQSQGMDGKQRFC
jgi:hypothetical protein